MFFFPPYIGNNNPNWLIFFQRGWNHQPYIYILYILYGHKAKKDLWSCDTKHHITYILSLYQRSIDLFWTPILWTLPATTFGVCRKSSLSVYQPLCGWTGYWICIQAIYRDLHLYLYLYIYIWMFQKVVQYPKNMLSLFGQKLLRKSIVSF
jgi:hypothetical protein